ncbi:Peroxisome biogenesis protein 19-1 [Rhizoctonia solani]|uniref:Peroxisome biogenesis protein 19-1 n=1 Tax=Rhizoctonia solani TaxID=456999 RepID=A0A0K6FUT7_9AGAM|nr:Peroxisome biogenesis protein 19-1 [Rhizoctonia solani]
MTTPPSNAGKPAAPPPAKPEEEDLDELDDLLDQFTPAPVPAPTSTSTAKAPSTPPADAFTEDFEAALAREMEAMMRGESTESTNGDMAAAWQKLLIGDLEGTTNPQEDMDDLFKNLGVNTDGAHSEDDAFQRTIRQAMDKLKTSDENAKASGSADDLAELLKQLGEGGQDEDGLQGMIEGMMGQLMSKEILYEPLVEMNDKFPAYFVEHPDLPEADVKKYKAQQAIVKQLVDIYQKPNYSDDNPETNKEVLRLMNEMQELGSPPTEIMGEVPAGFDFNSPEGMAKMMDADGCVVA